MTDYKWHAIYCDDCGVSIAFSPEPLILLRTDVPMYCGLCAQSHAKVAGYVMPVGNNYMTHSLYGLQTSGKQGTYLQRFTRGWDILVDAITKHKIAKAEKS